jgi:hypothetical protein
MKSVRDVQIAIDRVRNGVVPTGELCDLLRHPSPLVRVNAANALVDLARKTPNLLEELVAAASDSANGFRLMGSVSVAHVIVGALVKVATAESVEAVKGLIRVWPDADLGDLEWYLRSEGLEIGSPD